VSPVALGGGALECRERVAVPRFERCGAHALAKRLERVRSVPIQLAGAEVGLQKQAAGATLCRPGRILGAHELQQGRIFREEPGPGRDAARIAKEVSRRARVGVRNDRGQGSDQLCAGDVDFATGSWKVTGLFPSQCAGDRGGDRLNEAKEVITLYQRHMQGAKRQETLWRIVPRAGD